MHNYIFGGLIAAVGILAYREMQREKQPQVIRTADGYSTDTSVHDLQYSGRDHEEFTDGTNVRTAFTLDLPFLPMEGRVVTNINEAGGLVPVHFENF